jgi:hypothetical protein
MDIKRSRFIKVMLFVSACMLVQSNAPAAMVANWSPVAFDDNGSPNPGHTISYYLTEGGGCFLKSHSVILNFLHKIELWDENDPCYDELQALIGNAISYMESARSAYVNLTCLADITPYNQEVIRELITFNYGRFRLNNSLNFSILWDVRIYLKRGDVRGLYHKMIRDSGDILNVLYDIQAAVDAYQLPEIARIWSLNHRCFLFLIFNQYTSMVFYEIVQNL